MIEKIVLHDPHLSKWLTFTEPNAVVTAHTLADVVPVIEEVERYVHGKGWFAAGFVTYEAAPGFDSALAVHQPGILPLVMFGLFGQPIESSECPSFSKINDFQPTPWRESSTAKCYSDAFSTIKEQIAAGNVYQINHTVRLTNNIDADSLYERVVPDARYGALIDTKTFAIVSASPELFFRQDQDRLISTPMKGTVRRGLDNVSDKALKSWLASSEKNKAENLMITDMVRNDFGRIASPGSTQVTKLFDVEQYPTVWQMTSTVECRSKASITKIFQALFPGASITGAPKHASMKLIAKLEHEPREIYTGAIGYIAPDQYAQFSIAIRTAWCDKQTNQATYGVGGGIVWDSDEQEEIGEIVDKAAILHTQARPTEFQLLETMRWQPGKGIFLEELHLKRLIASAGYFQIPLDEQLLQAALEEAVRPLDQRTHRLRVLVGLNGDIQVQAKRFDRLQNHVWVLLAAEPIDRKEIFLYHKTTHREMYERAVSSVAETQEALLFNSEGQVTESTIANVVYRLQSQLFTPPVSCGLLPGVYREFLLNEGKLAERPLKTSELDDVDGIYLINALRGWRDATLVDRDLTESGQH